MYKSDPTKQIIIMSQSATRLAVEIALQEGKTNDFQFIGNTAHKLMNIELKLASIHIPELQGIAKTQRKEFIENLLKSINDMETLRYAWSELSEDEQIEYKSTFDELIKSLK